jgi:small conductance mechanosensitive channel
MNDAWQKFLDKATDWMITFGPRIILAIVALFAGLWVIRFLNRQVRNVMDRKKIDLSLRPFLQNLLHIILVVLLVIGLMQILGIQMTVFAAMIAALTVAAGLALSGTLQNFANGVLLLVQRPFRVGDNINTQGTEGTVLSIRLFYTIVRTYDNKTIFIPNGQLSNNVIINLSREGKRRMDIDLSFPLSSDVDRIRSIIQKTIGSMEALMKEPATRIGVNTLEKDKFTLQVNVWASAHGFNDTRMALQELLLKDLKANGMFGDDK